jgi:hypothetical protein
VASRIVVLRRGTVRQARRVSDVLLRDDASRLHALRQGDESAFLRLVDRHHSALRVLALLRTGDPAEAEAAARGAWERFLAAVDGEPPPPDGVRLVLFGTLLERLPAGDPSRSDAEVVLLRVRHDWPADDVERLLGLGEAPQRAALARARLAERRTVRP